MNNYNKINSPDIYPFPILKETDQYIITYKPSTFFVHPPEDKNQPIVYNKIFLFRIEKQLKRKLFPVHRLDVGTNGLLIMAKNSEAAKNFCSLFKDQQVKKTYLAVARGHFPIPNDEINTPLELDSTGLLVPAITSYESLNFIKIKNSLNDKYPWLTFTLLKVTPHTGRFHQIRRHFNRISHPLIGDTSHGDTRVNRIFKEHFAIQGLCLHAHQLEFIDPWTQNSIQIQSPLNEKWNSILSIFNTQLNPNNAATQFSH